MNVALSRLNEACSRHFRFRDLVACGESYDRLRQERPEFTNAPQSEESWTALASLATKILDPVVDRFGSLKLTYAFTDAALARAVPGRNDPSLDQHAAHECTRRGTRICDRDGAAADFFVSGVPSNLVARYVRTELPYDRLYFYSVDRPIHVSWSQVPAREVWVLSTGPRGRRVPRRPRAEDGLG